LLIDPEAWTGHGQQDARGKRFYLAQAKHTWDHLIQQLKSRLFVNLDN